MRLMRHNEVLVHSNGIRGMVNSNHTRENKYERYGGVYGYSMKVNRVERGCTGIKQKKMEGGRLQ